jgi:F0F1-type ATP synthase epsilon subunit
MRRGPARRERHPEIRAAIRALERAKRRLEAANHDFGGHRVEALAAVNKAIEQLRVALQYDKD